MVNSLGQTIQGADYFSPDDYSVAGPQDVYGNPILGWEGLGMGVFRTSGINVLILSADSAGPRTFVWDERYNRPCDISHCGTVS